jgi:cytidyltransferase-like protein
MYILITGGFDPLHSGHIHAFTEAARIGKLIVAPNSDDWLIRKKKSFLLPRSERVAIIRSLKMVEDTISSWDDYDDTSCGAIKDFYARYRSKGNLFFANGGDRGPLGANESEVNLCEELGIFTLYGLGQKTQSSSKFLADYVHRLIK